VVVANHSRLARVEDQIHRGLLYFYNMSTEEVWDEYSFTVLRYFESKVNSISVAEDLRQDVFIRVHGNLDKLEEEQKVQNWLSVVSRNVLIDYWKTLGKARENATDQVQTESDFFGEAATQCVTNMIAEMPSEYGEPLQLSEIEGMKQKDVAKRLGLSISGAKSRIQRGRKLLRKSITTCCHIELNRRNELVDGECRNSNCDCSQ